MIPATLRQKQLLDAIVRLSAGGVAPTLDELAREVGCASKSSIHRTLVSLRARGLITWAPNRARSIGVTPSLDQALLTLLDDVEEALTHATNRFQAVERARQGQRPIPQVVDAHKLAELVLCRLSALKGRLLRGPA